MNNARKRNIDGRIDDFHSSPALRQRLEEVFIPTQVMGLEHCPIEMVLEQNEEPGLRMKVMAHHLTSMFLIFIWLAQR